MRRTFLSITGRYDDEVVGIIVEGIQTRGGTIINVALNELANGLLERLLIIYEDHDNNEEIKKFLSYYLIIK